MASIKFDGTEILDTTHVPRFMKHESAPLRSIQLLDLTRDDGQVVVSIKYAQKTIKLQGVLTGSSQADLESKIDTFKELFSRQAKNLVVDWNGTTRTYVATCMNHEFNRDHFNILFVPWTAEFLVPAGIGEAPTETTIINNSYWVGAYTDYSGTWTLGGTAKPRPRIYITFDAALADCKGIQLYNTTTGERLTVNRAAGWDNASVLEIDCRLKTVKYDGVAMPFIGKFPLFNIGANTVQLIGGDITDQEFQAFGTGVNLNIYGNDCPAMSFMVPYTDDTYQGIGLKLAKTGTPSNLEVEIQTDNDGEPSGTPVTNATFEILPADILGIAFFTIKNSINAFTLNANTRYWIVCRQTAYGGDVGNKYTWLAVENSYADYKKGNVSLSADAETTWTDTPNQDASFRLLYGGLKSMNAHVNVKQYYSYL